MQAGGVRSVVVAGMGGSAIGAEIAAGHLAGTIGVPFSSSRNYDLPAFVGPDTVVVAASYSGNTEETLAAYRVARAGARDSSASRRAASWAVSQRRTTTTS